MLSPSKLFFGMPDPELQLDGKPLKYCEDGLEMWPESDDADDRTDVPADPNEQSAENSLASLNESEEERRSPIGPAIADPAQRVAVSSPTAIGHERRVPARPPPGLALLGTGSNSGDECLQSPPSIKSSLDCISADDLRSPIVMRPVLECNATLDKDSDDDEEEADDEADRSDSDAIPKGLLDSSGAVRFSELPSIGSANHFSGNCDRCCFHPKGRCLNGYNCQHCHFDHEKRKRKNKKKNKFKQLGSLTCDGDMDMMSATDGSSMPVSPDAPFGGGMLPQIDFPVGAAGQTPPQLTSPSGYLSQQTSYFAGTDAGSRPTSSALGDNQWFQAAAAGAHLQSSPPHCITPPLQEGSSFSTSPPPGYDFPGQLPAAMGHTLIGSPAETAYGSRLEGERQRYGGELPSQERMDEYIQQLEAENRYLRSCLIQYMGPNAAAVSLLPPPAQQPFYRQPEGLSTLVTQPEETGARPPLPFGPCPPPPPSVPAPIAPGVSMAPVAGLDAIPSATQGLSASAPPFWPAWQDSGESVDASTRFEAPTHHATCLDQNAVALRQDPEGQVVSTSSVGHLLADES